MYETWHKIMTEKFTKSISYMIGLHPFPGHIIYSHVHTMTIEQL